jgi:hypothetical protein
MICSWTHKPKNIYICLMMCHCWLQTGWTSLSLSTIFMNPLLSQLSWRNQDTVRNPTQLPNPCFMYSVHKYQLLQTRPSLCSWKDNIPNIGICHQLIFKKNFPPPLSNGIWCHMLRSKLLSRAVIESVGWLWARLLESIYNLNSQSLVAMKPYGLVRVQCWGGYN